ncbi:hypothetical protein BZA05DRAFT_339219 [Tricharina praecox]|uniref:uncharacterized protein n=1 Tax=Tricharina praecox TaxID=43433 RepID=UPI00221EA133|nr:uncharacterized protein BZA05DRAFT_339219 [Tricharina praecox]KAI5849907.1 hypothetical protein BZA05DRAFT_339219 [Tricharina praecox]
MAHGGGAEDHNEIALQHRDCLQSFSELLQLTVLQYHAILPAIQEQFARFRVWAENVGAHRVGRVSLDYRLREAADVKAMVIELLSDLNEALKDALTTVSTADNRSVAPPPSPPAWPPNDQQSPAEPVMEELDECLGEVRHVVTCLYKFSIAIQNPAPLRRLQKSSVIDVSHFEHFDIQHISNKFPGAHPYLVERLGRSNTRRRQLLRYHELHHDKVAGRYGTSKKRPATHTLSATTVTAYERTTEENTLEQLSDAGFSQTSYSSSVYGIVEKLRVPPPPSQQCAFQGEAFQCPYCFIITTVTGQKSWKKYFFRDLRPYVCTFKECPKSDHLFDNRNEWYQHEMKMHRREYFCNACHETLSSHAKFQEHLREKHSNLFNPDELQTILDRCERLTQSEQLCPLCPEKHSLERLRRHLGGHLKQIALFIPMPRDDEDAEKAESVGAEADESQDCHRSGNGSSLDFESNPTRTSAPDWPEGRTNILEDDNHLTPAAAAAADEIVNISEDHRDYETALEWHQRALDGSEKLLGKGHSSTLEFVQSIAKVFYAQGDYETALEWHQRALDGSEKSLGKGHLGSEGNSSSNHHPSPHHLLLASA